MKHRWVLILGIVLAARVIVVFAEPKTNNSIVTAIEGNDVILSCQTKETHAAKALEYAWINPNNVTLIFNNNTSSRITLRPDYRLRISRVRYSDRGVYVCQVSGSSLQRHSVQLNVLVPPRLSIVFKATATIEIHSGEDLQLNCSAIGNPVPAVHWLTIGRQNDTGCPGVTTQSIAINPNVSLTQLNIYNISHECDNHIFECLASNGVLPDVYRRHTVKMVAFPLVLSVRKKARVGDNVLLVCSTKINPPPNIRVLWEYRGVLLDRNTSQYDITTTLNEGRIQSTLNIRHLKCREFGTYLCVASKGREDKSAVLLKVVRIISSDAPCRKRARKTINSAAPRPSSSKSKKTKNTETTVSSMMTVWILKQNVSTQKNQPGETMVTLPIRLWKSLLYRTESLVILCSMITALLLLMFSWYVSNGYAKKVGHRRCTNTVATQ